MTSDQIKQLARQFFLQAADAEFERRVPEVAKYTKAHRDSIALQTWLAQEFPQDLINYPAGTSHFEIVRNLLAELKTRRGA